ncbi:MAG TPA: cytochrome P450 [Dehalococcoidia bacterium]|nr:cytochrome P450 [Dehalococcoidia bacterium]
MTTQMTTAQTIAGSPPALDEVAPDLIAELDGFSSAPDPYPTYARWRQAWPVSQMFGAVNLLRYADVEAVLRHPRVSADDRNARAHREQVAQQRLAPQYLSQMDERSFLHRDPPDHTRLRRLVTRAFTPQRIEALRPDIQAFVDAALDTAAGEGWIELVDALAYPLPIAIISRLTGIPAEDGEIVESLQRAQLCCTFEPASVFAVKNGDGETSATQVEANRIQQQLSQYFDGMIAQRRRRPGSDLVSALIAAEEQGERLSHEEINATLRLLFIGGYETTVNLLGNGVLALLRYPDQLAALRQNAALASATVDEVMRYDAPFQFTRRIALDDLEIGGYRIDAGTTILLWLAAADRDPAQFSEPDRFDITRGDNRHLAFGTGIHACLGGPLARLQGEIVFETLARRLVDPALEADPPAYLCDVFRALQALPIGFRAVRPADSRAS